MMIRVIYIWHVEPEKIELFIETWKATTNEIHKNVRGARGSFMLRNIQNSKEIKTIARWDSFEDWRVFWLNKNRTHMQSMHELGKRISVEAYDEIDDYTK
ncbi:antibiotic biosynthesis monooxygenase [Flavivirga aquimarina]|uniref:Antibiotic biosynthesis monooxygenase n=1 Tax=Flavivirga aquimarina TaxID=2027862 RepID=A0ABT8WAV4_9FLAO|nr:antibiotic biosynthesis monooxygenase [Flavivirga aquimarina]MDO5970263.1 antibiotic biosynthesis monooxygenase [Flavivirga aquimarina]